MNICIRLLDFLYMSREGKARKGIENKTMVDLPKSWNALALQLPKPIIPTGNKIHLQPYISFYNQKMAQKQALRCGKKARSTQASGNGDRSICTEEKQTLSHEIT